MTFQLRSISVPRIFCAPTYLKIILFEIHISGFKDLFAKQQFPVWDKQVKLQALFFTQMEILSMFHSNEQSFPK